MLLVLLLFFVANIALSNETSDIIYLKNGTKVIGKIIKFDVDKEVIIKTESGSELQYKMSDVDKIDFKSESFYQYKKTSAELGVTIGTPASLNLVAGKHFENTMIKASGFYLGDISKGIQLELGYKLAEFARTYHAINIVAGVAELRESNAKYINNYIYKSWQYIGVVYNLNTNGFYLQTGLSHSYGDFSSPQLLLQIGYVYQFRD